MKDKFGRNVEGYWYSKYETNWPMPVAGVLSEDEAKAIFDLIKKKEKSASKTLYRGPSTSRLEDTLVGSAEYELDNWIWPAGFAEHYVLKHKVKPSDEFLVFIGGESV